MAEVGIADVTSARLVAAYGSSHSTMLFSAEANWQKLFDHVDVKVPVHDTEGIERSFDYLLAHLPSDAAERIAPALMAQRHQATMAALDRLQRNIAADALDVLVIVGDDQRELFKDHSRPAMAIYTGAQIRNAAAPANLPDNWYFHDQARRLEDGRDVHYPCHPALANFLAQGLSASDFDFTVVNALVGEQFEGHAYSFVHRRLTAALGLPVVPIFLNTYYPPNVPTPQRCRALGQQLGRLIASFPAPLRVGVMASGGLSHFRVDEELDAEVVRALRDNDLTALAALQPHRLQGGSSEIRNWICVAAAVAEAGLALDWLEYVPAYRSRALTGVGLGFARWGK